MICLEGNKKEITRDWERINIPSIKKLYYRSYEMFGLERDTGPTRIRVCGNPWILSYLHLVWGETLVPHVRVLGVRCFFFCAGGGGGRGVRCWGWGGGYSTFTTTTTTTIKLCIVSRFTKKDIYLCHHQISLYTWGS